MPTPHPTGVTREGVRVRTDRFGDTWTVHTGPAAARIRAALHAEQTAALKRGDETGDYAEFRALADTEARVGERLAAEARKAAA